MNFIAANLAQLKSLKSEEYISHPRGCFLLP